MELCLMLRPNTQATHYTAQWCTTCGQGLSC